MHNLCFSQQTDYPIVFLVPTIRKDEIEKEYLNPFGIPQDDVLVLGLHYNQSKKKTPAAEMKAFISDSLLPVLSDIKTKYLVVADSDYFKVLTKAVKVDANLGYVLDCIFGDYKVVYVPNYKQIFYDPVKIRAKISLGLNAMVKHIQGSYSDPGSDIIKFAEYPTEYQDIKSWLNKLLEMDCDLTCDIEAFSLKHNTAGIGTITFAWNKHEGIAFPVDYLPFEGATEAPYGRQVTNLPVRRLLVEFFRKFKKNMVYHNISYDVYVLIYQLFMDNLLDTSGLLKGMEVMLTKWDDTKLITYLATNSCAGNKLGLKDQAQEFAGNYAKDDITDITKIPLPELLQYNLVDGLSTWYVYEKHRQTVINDQQEDIYQNLFKPATIDIIQMQLTGLPLSMDQTLKVEQVLAASEKDSLDTMLKLNLVQKFTYQLNEDWAIKRNSELKVKRVSVLDGKEEFNPNSGPQLQKLLFEVLNLPVLTLTDSKLPSTDGDTIKSLKNHTQDAEILEFLDALIAYKAVNKILTSFIPAMKNAALGPDGWHYLFGNFNLGGTLSGRLSSSDPNLQNLPANVYMVVTAQMMKDFGDNIGPYVSKGSLSLGKLIKSCFQAPPGWVFCGLDFALT